MDLAESTEHSLERRLITCCARTKLSDELISEIRSILTKLVDWDHIVGITSRNAITPLVSRNLLKYAQDLLPEKVREELKRDLTNLQSRNLFLTGELLKIVGLLEDQGIDALPFKGPILALQAYGNPCLRQYTDLDVLVLPSQFVAAVLLLQENGFEPLTGVSWLERSNWYVSPKKDVYFVNQYRTVTLELHWKLSGSHFDMGDTKRLWERLESIELGGRSINVLPFEDHLIYLCMHGSRHGWERLQWVCDIYELILANNDVSWAEVFARARKYGCLNLVLLTLCLVRECYGFSVPLTHLTEEDKRKTLNYQASDLIRRLFSVNAKSFEIGARYNYHLALKERKRDRFKLHFHYLRRYLQIIVTPSLADDRWVQLPYWLRTMRFVLRPIRLIYEWFAGVKVQRER